MYLDHLKSSQTAAVASSVSFSDVMQEAMYATEVCSAADAYLIKAEAEMLVLGSESEGEGGFWAKVKIVIRKIWEVVKNLANKIYIFIKSIPGKIMAFYQKRVMMSSLKNLPELWKKAKAEGRLAAAKGKGIKYFDMSDVEELKNLEMPEPSPNATKEDAVKVREKLAEIRDLIRKKIDDKDSNAWVDASQLTDDDVTELINASKSGKLPASASVFIKDSEKAANDLRKMSDAEVRKYDVAFRNKDQEAAKQITENLSVIRSMLIEAATNTNFYASVIFRTLASKANAIKSIAGLSGNEEPESSKK